MSAFPITGSLATISSVTAATDVKTLFDTLKITEVTINTEADEFDISELSGSGAAVERLAGLRSGTMNFSGIYPKSAPKVGNTGLVTYGGNVAGYVSDWTMDVDFGETEVTSFASTAPTVKQFMPNGLLTWGGSFNMHMMNIDNSLDSATNDEVTLPTAVGSTGSAAIFRIFTGASNNHELSGNVLLKSLGHAIKKADKQVLAYSYSGSGALTEKQGDTYSTLLVASTSAGTSTAVGARNWSPNATPANSTPAVTVTLYTSRTYAFAAFMKSVSINVSPGNPITVSGSLRIFDTIATA